MVIRVVFAVFILFVCYWFLYSFESKPLSKPDGVAPIIHNYLYSYEIKKEGDRHLFITNQGDSWVIPQHPDFFITDGEIKKTNECSQVPDGTKVPAQGQKLYEYFQAERLKFNDSKEFKNNMKKAIQNSRLFYYECQNNEIADLYMCSQGNTFHVDHCQNVNPCSYLAESQIYADLFDSRRYYRCINGQPVSKRCPSSLFFINDSCQPKSGYDERCQSGSQDNKVFAINNVKYFRCQNGKPVVHQCHEGTYFNGSECVSDLCLKQPDGRVALPQKHTASLRYHPGYAVCRKGQMVEKTICSQIWNRFETNEVLSSLPAVYDPILDKCTTPSFCQNVFPVSSEDVIVPVYEFDKHAKEWKRGLYHDMAVGYKCTPEGQKVRTPVTPGNIISEYREVSACRGDIQNVPIGDEIFKYFDCQKQSIETCPADTYFKGTQCVDRIPNSIKYKNIDISRYEDLSPINNWMTPSTYDTASSKPICEEPTSVYINGYNICAHPACAKYPFLKQLVFGIYDDKKHMCYYSEGAINQTPIDHHDDCVIDVTAQRLVFPDTPLTDCVTGEHPQTGFVSYDRVLYMTCDPKQPYVFCPSTSTLGIQLVQPGGYACVPKENVYEGIIPANTETTFYVREIDRFVPVHGAKYVVNGMEYIYNQTKLPDGVVIRDSKSTFTIWSEKEVKIYYKNLVTYPPNIRINDKQLKAYPPSKNYILKEQGSTTNPLTFPNHKNKVLEDLKK